MLDGVTLSIDLHGSTVQIKRKEEWGNGGKPLQRKRKRKTTRKREKATDIKRWLGGWGSHSSCRRNHH